MVRATLHLLLVVALPLGLAPPAQAQNLGLIATDGSIGGRAVEVGPGVDPTGQTVNYLIPAELGTPSGDNLFHSFARFGIGAGEIATFTGPDSVKNVISRVTGGESSNIYGTLRSTMPNADVWLLNPSGIVFGEGAQLEVRGSFHAATADYLGFAGTDDRFGAKLQLSSVLSAAPPATFGFLPETVATSIAIDRGTLKVPDGEMVELAGGDISLSDAAILAPNGDVSLAAQLNIELLRSTVDVSGDTPGSVFIRGGQLVVQGGPIPGDERSLVLAESSENRAAGPRREDNLISVETSESVLLDNGLLSVFTLGAGDAGRIEIASPIVTFQNGPLVRWGTPEKTRVGAAAGTLGSGAAGTIHIAADELTLAKGGNVTANGVGSHPVVDTGNAGRIEIVAHSLEISERSIIVATAWGSTGNGGSVTIDLGDEGTLRLDGAADPADGSSHAAIVTASEGGNPGAIDIHAGSVEVLNGGLIRSICNVACASQTDDPDRPENAGTLRIRAGRLVIQGSNSATPSEVSVFAEAGGGDAGQVAIDVGALEIRDRGIILASTQGAGDGGTIGIDADSVVIENGGSINAETTGTGKAGAITIDTGSLAIRTGGVITSTSRRGGGNAGSIGVTAHEIFVTNLDGVRFDPLAASFGSGVIPSGIYSAASGSGAAGSIALSARDITVTDGAVISSSTFGGGFGVGLRGTVDLSGDRIRIANGGLIDTRTMSLLALPGGPAGDIALAAAQWIAIGGASTYGDPSTVSSTSLGESGVAGAVTLRAPSVHLFDGGVISTNAESADGGNVAIQAQHLVHLDAGQITSSVNGATGGNIAIDPEVVILQNGSRIAATAVTGTGGHIQIDTDHFFAFPGSVVSAASGNPELSGTVEIASPGADLAGSIIPLPASFLDAASQMHERCTARRGGERAGSFAVRGAGGIPAEPDGWLPAPVVADAAAMTSLPGPMLASTRCP
jgi:filamentous hemagglutinin family protein